MHIRIKIVWVVIALAIFINAEAQESPTEGTANLTSGNITAGARFASTPVNHYTGMTAISIPLYNWSNQNGLSLAVSLDYFSGGIRVNESPSTVGLGWNLSAGGFVSRSIRGMPDDFPWKGFLCAAPVPLDYTQDATTYYHDSLDAQQDIFQFSFNGRSGKFFIGKNKQIVTVPISKLRITYKTSPVDSSIISFCIITEDGIKYEFNDLESGRLSGGDYVPGYTGYSYNTAWSLSIITPIFGKDTIRFEYVGGTQTRSNALSPVGNIGTWSDTLRGYEEPVVAASILSKRIRNIFFPDKKKLSFIYDPAIKYDRYDMGLNSMRVSDSVFRYGYHLLWSEYYSYERGFLTGLEYYTNKYEMKGYKFYYTSPHFQQFGSPGDSLWNKTDHWGFYNGADNGTNELPSIPGIYTGTNREPNSLAVASSLSCIEDPSGGKTYYEFENNDIYRLYTVVPQTRRLNVKYSHTDTIHVNHVTNNSDSFTLTPQMFYIPDSGAPFNDTSAVIWRITNLDSSVTYATDTIDFGDLFLYEKKYSFNVSSLANGDYLFKTRLLPGSSVSAHALWVYLKWINQEPFDSLRKAVGGLRIKQVSHYDPATGKTDTLSTYKYTLVNGRSSGFLGVEPIYNHMYGESVYNESTASTLETNFEKISARPVNRDDYSQGGSVGYSRVEVIKGSMANNLGKEVYEFSSLSDSGLQVHPKIFPYTPHMQEDWLLGLNKKTSVYDSSGRLVQQTINTYHTVTQSYLDSNYRSLKLGLTSAVINDSNRVDTYIGEYYFPKSGRADLVSSTQTFYYPDNSQQVKSQQIQYDSNYNVIKIISGYDQSRGLSLERRMYYPYNYSIAGVIGTMRDSAIYAPVSSEDWIIGDSNERMLAASITDFQQLPDGSIKPLATYALQSKKPIPLATIDTFIDDQLVRNAVLLKKQQEFVRFDSSGNCLEVRNSSSGQSNAVIMDYHNTIPVAKITNAKNSDVAYTSFESDGSGNWLIGSEARIRDSAITGKRCYNLDSGTITKDLDDNLIYIITYWKKANATVNISDASNVLLADEQNGWKFYTQTIENKPEVQISGSGLIDELRLYPKDANMSTSTYEPMVGVTSTCDANNTISYYEYDSTNKLIVIRDKDLNILKKYEYSDSLTIRNLDSFAIQHVREAIYDSTSHSYKAACFVYRRYLGMLLSEGEKLESLIECPRNLDAGEGMLPVD